MRYHLIRKGRIVASSDTPDPLEHRATSAEHVVTDDWWRHRGYFRLLRDVYNARPVKRKRQAQGAAK